MKHALNEIDEERRKAGKVDVGEVVRSELLPSWTVVGKDDVGGSFENDESETEGEKVEIVSLG